ncbi:MAG: hypothetical protein K2M87_05240 [Muribaculaceae bacterium]|nr:hypothetical protein [Muribaculaceae bacterium]
MTQPYFIIPDIEALNSAAPEERTRLMRRIAVNIGNENALRRIFGIDPEEFANFYPDMFGPQLTTEDTIDSFIDRFSPGSASVPADSEGVIPIAPAIDYATMLEMEQTKKERNEKKQPEDKKPVMTDKHVTEQKPSMTLFRQLVKNQDYSKALEIIETLNLNNPEKSIYFAYQVSFLKKLIENQASGTI